MGLLEDIFSARDAINNAKEFPRTVIITRSEMESRTISELITLLEAAKNQGFEKISIMYELDKEK